MRLEHPPFLDQISDHRPLLCRVDGTYASIRRQFVPSATAFDRVVQELVSDDFVCAETAWSRILGSAGKSARMVAPRLVDLDLASNQLSLDEITQWYYKKHREALGEAARSRFSWSKNNKNKSWFRTLKALTKYDQFAKRDGSFVKAIRVEGKILFGRAMHQQITKWHQGLAAPLPRLAQEPVFPAIVLSDDELERLACGPRYTKAYSWDCVGHFLF